MLQTLPVYFELVLILESNAAFTQKFPDHKSHCVYFEEWCHFELIVFVTVVFKPMLAKS
jgi:hypothetical protein